MVDLRGGGLSDIKMMESPLVAMGVIFITIFFDAIDLVYYDERTAAGNYMF